MNDDDTLFEQALAEVACLSRFRRRRLLSAAREVIECQRVLARGGLNVVGELLRGNGAFVEYDHYPPRDVYDARSLSQYYYHAHRSAVSEHGHFHTFVRLQPPMGMDAQERARESGGQGAMADAVVHLAAISMDARGLPCGLFTTNRWVTNETMLPADDVLRLLRRFEIDHANPSWPVNRWIGAMLALFAPLVALLLRRRDARLDIEVMERPLFSVLEDRTIEVFDYVAVDLHRWVDAIETSLLD